MAKEDITQRLLSEIKSLNETNTSLKDAIKDYARTTANAMASNASATQAINQTTSSLTIWTDLFESIKKIVEDLKKTNIVEDKNTGTNVLTGLEKGRYAAIAKVFDSVLKVRSISKLLSTKTKISEANDKVGGIQAEKDTEEERYRNIGIIFNKIMKVSAISTQLESIKKILIKSELRQIESENDRNRALSFKSIDEDNNKNDKRKENDQKENKKSWITSFIEKIPIIGDVFRIARGLTKLLFYASPIIAGLTHFFTDSIAPWQGGADLLAKLYAQFKIFGGSFSDVGKAISEKFKSLLEVPMKFIEEKFPKLFAKIAPKSAERLKPLTSTAEKLLEVGTKGGFFSKLLRIGSGSLKFLARVPILGSILSAGFAYDRYRKGDYVGMLIEFANIFASAIPGAGTVLSIGLGVWQALRDWTRTPAENKQLEINKDMGFIDWMLKGMGDILKSVYDWAVDTVSSAYKWLKKVFGFASEEKPKIKLPTTQQGIQEYYDKQIDELNKAAKNVSGKSSLEARKNYNLKIEKLKKEKEEEFNKIGVGKKLPELTKPISEVAPTPKPPTVDDLKTPTSSIKIETPNDDKQWALQNSFLERIAVYSEIMAGKETKFQPTNITNSSNTSNESVLVRQQKSNTKQSYLNSILTSTNLAQGT